MWTLTQPLPKIQVFALCASYRLQKVTHFDLKTLHDSVFEIYLEYILCMNSNRGVGTL